MADRERIPLLLWLSIAAFIALAALAVVWGVPHFEDDIGTRAQDALGDLPVTVAMEGRDAVLSGSAEAGLADQAERIVRNVRGVRDVENDITITGDAAANPPPPQRENRPPPSFEASVADGAVTLAGRVPNADAAAELAAATAEAFGPANVVNGLEVADVTSPDWLVGLPDFLTGFVVVEGTLMVVDTGAQLAGVVNNEETKQRLGEELAAATGLPVTNALEVVLLPAPTFTAAKLATETSVALTGELPDEESIADVVSAAEQVYGMGNVVDELTVGDVDSPAWVTGLPGIFGRLTGLDPWTLAVEEGVLLIVGEGPDDGTLGRIEDAFTDFETAGLQIETILQINSESVATALTELLEGSTTFETGSAQLSAEATALLDEAIVILIDNPATRLIVEGHTDNVGDAAANLALSQSRAQAVVDYLVAGGVDAARLTAVGFGEDRPIADNATAEGRAQNRRIEFVVEEGAG